MTGAGAGAVRVYVPATVARLAAMHASGGVGPAPLAAHAVTEALRAAYPDGGDEEREWAAMTSAAQASLDLLTEDDVPRRVVVALDSAAVRPASGEDPTTVLLDEVVPVVRVAAVHVDSVDAEADVAAAREARLAEGRGAEQPPGASAATQDDDPGTEVDRLAERCVRHDLEWYATQEIGDLLARLGGPDAR